MANEQNLKPWVKGQSGNPLGRSKGIAAQARAHSDRCIEILSKALASPDDRVAIAAANSLLDRAYGKPIAMSADVTNKLDQFDDEFLVGALDALRAARRDRERDSDRTDPETEH